MSVHSIGPWVLEHGENYCGGPLLTIRSADGKELICDETYYPRAPENPADWKLMAAAPVLLKELKHLVNLIEPLEDAGTLQIPGLATLNAARLAIFWAEGKEL